MTEELAAGLKIAGEMMGEDVVAALKAGAGSGFAARKSD